MAGESRNTNQNQNEDELNYLQKFKLEFGVAKYNNKVSCLKIANITQ